MDFFFENSLTMPKKTGRGTIWDFSKSILSKNIKKVKVGPFGEKNFRKKSLTEPKILFGAVEFLK